MLCVACLKSHKWGLFPPRSDPHNHIIWTIVNLFDILDEIHNLPSTLQLSKFVCPLRSPPPQTGPAFSASCSEDPATTQVWSSVFNNYKSCIVFGIFSKYSQHLWSSLTKCRQHLDEQSRIDGAADPAAAASTATAATSRSATTTSPAARRTSEQSLPSSRAGSSCRRRGRSSWRWSSRPAAALGPAADVAARGTAGEEEARVLFLSISI